MIQHPSESIQEHIRTLSYQVGGKAMYEYLTTERSRCLNLLVKATDQHTLHRLQGVVMTLDVLVDTLKLRAP
jgi:hypothetical protein